MSRASQVLGSMASIGSIGTIQSYQTISQANPTDKIKQYDGQIQSKSKHLSRDFSTQFDD